MDFGIEIKSQEKDAIQKKIEETINPLGMSNIDLYEKCFYAISKMHISKNIKECDSNLFYVEHSKGVKNRLYLSSKDSLIKLLENEIFPERHEGLDLIILSNDFSCAFMTNHDGGTFSIRI